MRLYDVYADDGYSGTNFDRPRFKQMMEDAADGKIDCVVVKDLSRFGREYIEAGRLIQKTFPALNVRFIAITDRYDSLTADFNERSLVLPVKNFVNDAYCRDISQKVKSHQRIMRENGLFIGAFPVYGYRKDERNKNRLVPDAHAAAVVRDIFAWRLSGMSARAIAGRLNALGVLSPLEYKRQQGERYATGFAAGVCAKWSAAAVMRILTNEVYLGTLEQGKREKISYKLDRCREKKREEWVRREDCHEAVVAKEDFERVKRLLESDVRPSGGRGRGHLFSGLLFCADCEKPMARRVNRSEGKKERVCFICATRNKGEGCTRHTVEEEALRECVLAAIRLHTALFADEAECLQRGEEEARTDRADELGQLIEALAEEKKRFKNLQEALAKDLQNGVVTREEFDVFTEIFREREESMGRAAAGQEARRDGIARRAAHCRERLARFEKKEGIRELDRELLLCFVSRIRVFEDKRLCVEFTGRECFDGGGS